MQTLRFPSRNMAPTFNSLPQEILQLIMDVMDRSTLIALRATCKHYAATAAPLVFRNVHLMFREKSFLNLAQISKHPVYRHHVQSIFYEPAILEEPYGRKEWEKHAHIEGIKTDKFPSRPPDGCDEREMRTYLREFKKVAAQFHVTNHCSKKALDIACKSPFDSPNTHS
jgi:hypothetical protein